VSCFNVIETRKVEEKGVSYIISSLGALLREEKKEAL
jgi:hypothetical protein